VQNGIVVAYYLETALPFTSLRSFALCALVSLLATTARADDKREASRLFEEAQKLRADGNYPAACPKLAQSFELDATLGTLLYLADCYEQIGRLASAHRTFRQAESNARAAGDEKRQSLAREAAEALERRLPRLNLVPDGPGELEIVLDGEPLPRERWGAVPVDPGEHVITLRASGYVSRTDKVFAPAPGETRRVAIAPLAPEKRAAPEEPADEGGGLSSLHVGAIVAGGFAVVAFAIGAGLAVHAQNTYDDSAAFCDAANFCQPQGLELREEAFDFATGADVAFIAGGVGAATAIALVIVSATRDESAGLRIVPAIGATAGIGIEGRW